MYDKKVYNVRQNTTQNLYDKNVNNIRQNTTHNLYDKKASLITAILASITHREKHLKTK
jgi:hypothetical protein